MSLAYPRRDKLNDELKMGEYLNDSLIVKLASSNDDNMLQNKQVNQFIDEGVDLLIVSPNQLSAISKSVERAYDKGIPVILYDRKTNSDKYTAFIGCDNYTIGKSMGTFIAQQLQGKGRIVEIFACFGASSWFYGCYQALSWVTGCSLGGRKLERRGWNPGDETHIETDTGL